MTHKSKLICSLFESIGVFGVLLALAITIFQYSSAIPGAVAGFFSALFSLLAALSAANVALAGYLLWKR